MIYQPLPIGRICRNCKQWTPRKDLTKNKSQPDGVEWLCLDCGKAQGREYYKQHRQEVLERERNRYETDKDRVKAVNKRSRDKHKDDALKRANAWTKANPDRSREIKRKWASLNKEKARESQKRSYQKNKNQKREYARQHRNENREKYREKNRKYVSRYTIRRKRYRQEHNAQYNVYGHNRRARVRMLPANFTEQDWFNCLEYWNDRCAVCARPIGLWHTLAMDHWIPISDPRSDNPGTVKENIIPLCHGEGGCNNSKSSRDPVEWLNSTFGPTKAKAILKRIGTYFASLVDQS